MFSDEFLAVIKADRERDIKAALRAHLVDRNRLEEEADTTSRNEHRSTGRIVRPAAQPGRATPDPSR